MVTATDEGFHEIQLNGKQLVFLIMAITVVSVVIFLLGVLVGRGVLAARGPIDAVEQAAQAASAPAPTGGAATSTTPTTAGETLSYAGRLNAPQPATEALKADPPPTVRESPPPAASEPAPAPAPAAAAPAPRPAEPAEPAGNGYAIQVAALAKLQEAEAIAARLNSKGYSAYVVSPTAGAPSVFRVRVGKFKDRREADTVAARLQKEEQFKPWIVR
jgi:cell division septation protein DedD